MAETGDQSGFLSAVLSVVARVGLMRHQAGKVGHLLLEIGIDGHRRAVVALVVVETRPRLVGHHLVDHGLGVGQRVGGPHDIAQGAGERADAVLETVRGYLVGPAVSLHPFDQPTGAAEHLVDAGVGGAVAIRFSPADLHVEVMAHLVDESDVLAGEAPTGAAKRPQMGGNEVRSLIGEPRGGIRAARNPA